MAANICLLNYRTILKEKGIRHELTVPHSLQRNGVAERINRTSVESARSLIAHAALSDSFWAEVVSTAAYVRNRLPTMALKENETPYKRWYGRKADVGHLRISGCMAYAHVPDSERRKLDRKSKKIRFVGYSLTSKGYRYSDETNRKMYIRRDMEFKENDLARAFAVQNNLLIPQMDVETAFLNGKLDEEIYMQQPEGYVKPGEEYLYIGVCTVEDVKNKQVFLHQGHDVEKMVETFGQTETKSVSTPAYLNAKLQKEDGFNRPVDVTSYQSIVGSPTQNHLTARKRILRYVKATAYLGLSYKKYTGGNLIGYSDVDWVGDMDDCHSTSGNVFSLACGAVSWLNKELATVVLSTTESEYAAIKMKVKEKIILKSRASSDSDISKERKMVTANISEREYLPVDRKVEEYLEGLQETYSEITQPSDTGVGTQSSAPSEYGLDKDEGDRLQKLERLEVSFKDVMDNWISFYEAFRDA
ncbi:Retrovirus-related Pol polyprotein from transposon TNT 1-94 [Stylophora pistillata]|uniref:Retrovirus-related Pol polyprotein from transposon TNT 1-94 n=1 Tax=Stylophora pistillata TaxID=50429 RepID=A0A2B4RXR0_STYPI|nr:Retrovirus-related Pol polyprotein from transposon TNT 1-94 [Stylophora pistillata]